MNPAFRHKRSRLVRGLIAMLIGFSGSLFSLTPAGRSAEESLGLDLLFGLRGKQDAPAEVVVVSIDRSSAVSLDASDEPERWPRSLHAALIQRLNEAGTALTVFNVFFGTAQPLEDDVMAEAMRDAGNVVLTDYLKGRHYGGGIYVESVAAQVSTLSEAALASAPFLLPQTAQARGFFTRSGDRDTLPVTLLHLYVLRQAFDELVAVVRSVDSAFADFFENNRSELQGRQGLRLFQSEWARRMDKRPMLLAALAECLRSTDISPPVRSSLQLLLQTSPSHGDFHFNHYGPVGTIGRVSYHRLIDAPPTERAALAGKVVFIGFSRDFQPESTEGLFYSPFSPVSSVELAATAFANLLQHATIRPLFDASGELLFLVLWGFLLGLAGQTSRLRLSVAAILAMSFAYLALAYYLFASREIWLPLILPLLCQAPAALAVSLGKMYRQRTRERHSMESVIQRFIPVDVVSQLVQKTEQGHVDDFGHLTAGVCVASDAGQYTALAENLDPMALTNLMNAYYGELFPAVTRNQGWISDVVGDAMMAVWTGNGNVSDIKRRGLCAALGMCRAATEFERTFAVRLPLRIGIHCGDMRVGLVGASGHNEFRATGDTVNTAARLEALNKLLGTKILVSEVMITDLEDFIARPLGHFVLAGKSQPVAVCELIGQVGEPVHADDLLNRFRDALGLFHAGRFREAQRVFAGLAADYPDDGPTRFYLDAATQNAELPGSDSGSGLIHTKKPPPGRPLRK